MATQRQQGRCRNHLRKPRGGEAEDTATNCRTRSRIRTLQITPVGRETTSILEVRLEAWDLHLGDEATIVAAERAGVVGRELRALPDLGTSSHAGLSATPLQNHGPTRDLKVKLLVGILIHFRVCSQRAASVTSHSSLANGPQRTVSGAVSRQANAVRAEHTTIEPRYLGLAAKWAKRRGSERGLGWEPGKAAGTKTRNEMLGITRVVVPLSESRRLKKREQGR
ncbi:hypothetical protein OPT61_g2392 [Boeremia exigua]|uniref:Uncharacterized protein n=1 Tax=Boeremia exigua TaxID=749465 RepID=A0ACC2ILX2_9PLEO|nr:hypothetical protein OPT61_g2392 [Boeremia exigua]